jgi:hypothetical protein
VVEDLISKVPNLICWVPFTSPRVSREKAGIYSFVEARRERGGRRSATSGRVERPMPSRVAPSPSPSGGTPSQRLLREFPRAIPFTHTHTMMLQLFTPITLFPR